MPYNYKTEIIMILKLHFDTGTLLKTLKMGTQEQVIKQQPL